MPVEPPAPRTPSRPSRPSSLRRRFGVPAFLLSAVLVVDALVGEKGYRQVGEVERERARLDTEIQRVQLDNAALRRQILRLRHDPRAIEELARRDLGLIKEGETLFIIRKRDAPLEHPSAPAPGQPR